MGKKIKSMLIDNVDFTPDCQNKWDFDAPIIEISSRGYDRYTKSFYVGFYLNTCNHDCSDTPIIEDELFARDFDTLKVKVRKWYKKHLKEALEKAISMLDKKYKED